MEKETGFSHMESLVLIESMINKAKNRFNEDGFMYLLWDVRTYTDEILKYVWITFVIVMFLMIIGGIGCWILSILATLIPPNYSILLASAAMIVAWIVPGYLLRSKYKRSKI